MKRFSIFRSALSVCGMLAITLGNAGVAAEPEATQRGQRLGNHPQAIAKDIDRSPIDLALSHDGRWIVTANQTSSSVSLIDAKSFQVVDEIACGEHPVDIEFLPKSDSFLVTAAWSGTVQLFRVAGQQVQTVASIPVGLEPHGIAITQDASRAYIGSGVAPQVTEIDLRNHTVLRRLDTGNWPKYLTLSIDDKRLAVGNGGDANIMVIDTESGEPLYDEPLANGTNFGQMRTSSDGQYAYFTWMVYRTNPIDVSNIQRGWILASRIGRVRLDGPSYREAISLDPPRKAVADPFDLEISPDGNRLVASSSGTHELLVYRLPDLPFVSTGGPGDLIDRRLEQDRDLFDRINLGGRPMGVRFVDAGRTVVVANYLRNAIQVVDIESKRVTREIDLGGPSETTLARRGMEVFYDATFSLDQWYSCHSCHQEGGSNARPMDTWNDGSGGTLKTVLPLYHVAETSPWTWHGWQTDLTEAMEKSVTETMQGSPPSERDKAALIAYLQTLPLPPNPYRTPEGGLNEAARRGEKLFHSSVAACADCHSGPRYTDGQVHDVGTSSPSDRYEGYNTPTLLGLHRRIRFLHSGSAKSIEAVITGKHSPEKVNGERPLTDDEAADLVAFLKSL